MSTRLMLATDGVGVRVTVDVGLGVEVCVMVAVGISVKVAVGTFVLVAVCDGKSTIGAKGTGVEADDTEFPQRLGTEPQPANTKAISSAMNRFSGNLQKPSQRYATIKPQNHITIQLPNYFNIGILIP